MRPHKIERDGAMRRAAHFFYAKKFVAKNFALSLLDKDYAKERTKKMPVMSILIILYRNKFFFCLIHILILKNDFGFLAWMNFVEFFRKTFNKH